MVSKILSAVALMAAAANAGSFTVQNSCDQQTLYYWVTKAQQAGQPDTGLTEGPFVVAPGASGSPQPYIQLATGGVAVAVNTVENIVGSQLLEYSYYGDDVQNWYDLSDINGTPFSEGGFMLVPSEISAGNCHGITCCAGTSTCPVVYNVWNSDTQVGPDNPMADCLGSVDLTFIACPNKAGGAVAQTYENAGCAAQGSGSSPAESSAAPAPTPVQSTTLVQNAKPLATSDSAPEIAVEVVTKMFTVTEWEKRAEATPEVEAVKRHMHHHAHGHGHGHH